jgi:hypothetical protein
MVLLCVSLSDVWYPLRHCMLHSCNCPRDNTPGPFNTALLASTRCTDVRRFCFKEISGKVAGAKMQVEIDGMAYSDSHVVLVERKPRICMEHVEELAAKV